MWRFLLACAFLSMLGATAKADILVIAPLPAPDGSNGVVAVPFTTLVQNSEPGATITSSVFDLTLINAADGGGYVINPGAPDSVLVSFDNARIILGAPVYGISATFFVRNGNEINFDNRVSVPIPSSVGLYSTTGALTQFSVRSTIFGGSDVNISNFLVATRPLDLATLTIVPVPEPASALLLGTGVLTLIYPACRRRRTPTGSRNA